MTDVIAFKTTRYKCPHCGKTGSSKARITEHASNCARDPNSRACMTCLHDHQGRLPVTTDDGRTAVQYEYACAVGKKIYGSAITLHCDGWQEKGE